MFNLKNNNMYLFEEKDAKPKRVYKMSKVTDRTYNRTKKLTDDEVRQIRALKGKMKGTELAIKFNVTSGTISNILNNKFKNL